MDYINEKLEEFNQYLRGRKVAIIGLGVSNIPLIDYLHDLKSNVTVFDGREIDAIDKTIVDKIVDYGMQFSFGVTGSDGKTTTTTLISEILKQDGYTVHLGGNIGTPLFTKIGEMLPEDIVVLELSSFQLMNMKISPNISVITNITPNHLNVHKDMEEYVDAKKNIFRFFLSLSSFISSRLKSSSIKSLLKSSIYNWFIYF